MKKSAAMAKKDEGIELLFKALADRTRLRIINLIGRGEVCVSLFVEVLNSNQPKISRHLAYLRRAGLVSARREGKWMHYRLVQPTETHAAQIFTEVCSWLAGNPEMQHDMAQLENIYCSKQLPVQLRKTPGPTGFSSHA